MHGAQVKQFHVQGLVEGYVQLHLTDEYGCKFTVDLDHQAAEFIADALQMNADKYRRQVALTIRPLLEAEVTQAIANIRGQGSAI